MHPTHQLSHIGISNFRACRSVEIPLGPYTPLVGQNNTGKSTILEAILWVLKPTLLSESDFNDSSKPISVAARIDGISAELLEKIPEQSHRKAIEPYCKDGTLWIRASARGTKKGDLSKEVWNAKENTGKTVPNAWRSYPSGLPEAVSVLLPDPLFVRAMQDIGEDLGKAKAGTTMKGLLDEIMATIVGAHPQLKSALETIRNIISIEGGARSDYLKEFDRQATEAVEHFFPGLGLGLNLQALDVKEFFRAGDLQVTDLGTKDCRRFDQMGSGAQRAIQMALVRYLAEGAVSSTSRERGSDEEVTSRRLLLVDEPELYLHPQGVRRLREALASLSRSRFQVVISTHSPVMLSRENAAATIVICKLADGCAVARTPLGTAVKNALEEAESQSRTLFELGNVAEIYFSERVVLCEGKTDRRVLSLAYERLFGIPPDADGVSFVSLGACSDFPKAMPVLRAMGIPALVVADLDFAFTHARAGKHALLDKAGEDLKNAKALLNELQKCHCFSLSANGLPENSRNGGITAACAWAIWAADPRGSALANTVHQSLLGRFVWVWKSGCIEDEIGCSGKGEDAVLQQEKRLREMDAATVRATMPGIADCLEWIRTVDCGRA